MLINSCVFSVRKFIIPKHATVTQNLFKIIIIKHQSIKSQILSNKNTFAWHKIISRHNIYNDDEILPIIKKVFS